MRARRRRAAQHRRRPRRAATGASSPAASLRGHGPAAGENGDHEEDYGYDDEHVADLRGQSRNAAETENGGDQRDDEKNQCPMQHGSSRRVAAAFPFTLAAAPEVVNAAPWHAEIARRRRDEKRRQRPFVRPSRARARTSRRSAAAGRLTGVILSAPECSRSRSARRH